MKYVKTLGLLAVAAAALMAFAGPASATTVTANGSATPYTGAIVATNEGSLVLHGSSDITCKKSAVEGELTTHGAGVTASGPIAKGGLRFSECDRHVKVLGEGSLTVHATSGGNGTLTSSGAEVTVEITTIFGNTHCVFATNNTDVGTLTGAASSSGHAVLDINSSAIPVISGNLLCGDSAVWTGTYKVTGPTGLKVDA